MERHQRPVTSRRVILSLRIQRTERVPMELGSITKAVREEIIKTEPSVAAARRRSEGIWSEGVSGW